MDQPFLSENVDKKSKDFSTLPRKSKQGERGKDIHVKKK